ncbi:MAG TPA: class I SAM-dependent methyltransferase [Xanthobacteraceae bacterium]|nr:class I SAM-dependent methyltransferase [Xanthobacteraceae bacterium]
MGDLNRTVVGWGWVDAIYRRRAQDILRKSLIHRHLPRHGLLLDIGSGLGHLAEAIVRDAPTRACVLVDPLAALSPRVTSRMKAFSLHAVRASGTRLPFPHSQFDGGWAAFVLHHLPLDDQRSVLGEVVRVLKPAAPFVLLEDTPASSSELAITLRADRRLNFEDRDAPHHYRSPDEWRATLPRHGLIVEREIPFQRVFPPATLRAVQHRAFLCRHQ